MFYSYNGYRPYVHETAWVHPQAVVTGKVWIGEHVYIGPGAALRGDWGAIYIEAGCNVQENCTLHMFPGKTVRLETAAHIGHGAIIHGAHVEAHCLVGMNAVVMDGVRVGTESIIGALAYVPAGTQIPARSVVVGNPARVIKQVTDEQLAWKTEGTRLYQQLPEGMRQWAAPCEPLREANEVHWPDDATNTAAYKPWQQTKP